MTTNGFFGTTDLRTVWNRARDEQPYLFLYDPASNRWVLSRTRQHLDQLALTQGVKHDAGAVNKLWRGYYFVEAQVLYVYPRWKGTHGTPPSSGTMRSIRSRLKTEFGKEPTQEYLIGEDPWLRPRDMPFLSREAQ